MGQPDGMREAGSKANRRGSAQNGKETDRKLLQQRACKRCGEWTGCREIWHCAENFSVGNKRTADRSGDFTRMAAKSERMIGNSDEKWKSTGQRSDVGL